MPGLNPLISGAKSDQQHARQNGRCCGSLNPLISGAKPDSSVSWQSPRPTSLNPLISGAKSDYDHMNGAYMIFGLSQSPYHRGKIRLSVLPVLSPCVYWSQSPYHRGKIRPELEKLLGVRSERLNPLISGAKSD